uniref:Malate dehydrogenase n=1 Tax=Glossina brevipalpis TaxID=37001 RepID=A0A1A9WHK1_9MUSC
MNWRPTYLYEVEHVGAAKTIKKSYFDIGVQDIRSKRSYLCSALISYPTPILTELLIKYFGFLHIAQKGKETVVLREKECIAFDVPQNHAEQQADLLVAADYRGHLSHGMNRLEFYLNDLSKKATDGAAVAKVLKESPATAWVDGCNGLGAVIGNFCMDLAIEKAKTVGVGWVCAKNCTHYGIAAWYPLRAIKEGFVGISMANTSPLMTPTRAKKAAIGTNPLAVGVPAGNGHFLLDMATTAVALGKIEIQRRKGENLPAGWALDSEGLPTIDTDVALRKPSLMPLGGFELNSGYKGYGNVKKCYSRGLYNKFKPYTVGGTLFVH